MGDEPTLAHARVDGTCHVCAAPLAVGQRYCLNCGARRDASGDPLAVLSPRPVAALSPVPPEPSLASRVGGGWGVAALVLLALGVGVVIGAFGSDDDPAPAAAPPVVTIAAGALSPTGPTGATVAPAPAPDAVLPAPAGPTGTSGATLGATP